MNQEQEALSRAEDEADQPLHGNWKADATFWRRRANRYEAELSQAAQQHAERMYGAGENAKHVYARARSEALEEAAQHLLGLQHHPTRDMRFLVAEIRALKDKT